MKVSVELQISVNLSPGADGSPQSTTALVIGVKVEDEGVTGDVSFRNPSMPTHPAHLDVSLLQLPARSPCSGLSS